MKELDAQELQKTEDNEFSLNFAMATSSHTPLVTKNKIKEAANNICEDLINKDVDPVKVVSSLSVIAALIDEVKSDDRVIEAIRDSVKKRGEKEKLTLGSGAVTIENVEVGTKYDYSKDDTWVQLDKAVKDATEKRKEREDLLKSIKPGMMQVHEETGEVVYGAAKSSKSSYKVTIASK
jgi:hypothetical protein